MTTSVKVPPTSTPVSYTHLDVYKRQTLDLRIGYNVDRMDFFSFVRDVASNPLPGLIHLRLPCVLSYPVSYTHLDVYKRQVVTFPMTPGAIESLRCV